MDFIYSLLPQIEHFHTIGYWIVFLATLLETLIGIGLIIPGSIIILLMGALSARGYFDIGGIIWFAVIGATIGDNINYLIGKKIGKKLITNGLWIIKPHYLARGAKLFNKYGARSVLLGRLILSLKDTNPLIAGAFGMKRLSFMIWDLLGIIIWSLMWILPGYFIGKSFNIAHIWVTRGWILLVGMIIFFSVIYLFELLLVKNLKKIFRFLLSISRSIGEAITENPDVKKLKAKHKLIFKFFKNRLNKGNLYGLPLTFLTLAFLYVLLLFGGVVEEILTSDLVLGTDIRVANVLVILRDIELTRFFLWITLLGKAQVVITLLISMTIVLWIWKKWQYILPMFVSVVGGQAFSMLGKYIFSVERPSIALYNEKYFSFPSAHATVAVAFYGFLTYIALRNFKSWQRRIKILFFGTVLISLISFSRMYLGVHYLSDVWGGNLIGALWLILGIFFLEFLLMKDKKYNYPTPNTSIKIWITIIAIFTSVIIYLNYAIYFTPELLRVNPSEKIVTISNTHEIFSNESLKYAETIFGNQQTPLSFIIMANSDDKLIETFNHSGWELADPVTIDSLWEIGQAAIWETSYLNAPMTPDFWNSKVNDFGFQKETELNNVRQRHHARFWKTNYVTKNGDSIYIGAASFDIGIKWGITHRISPDIDTERDFLLKELTNSGLIENVQEEAFVQPIMGKNFTGDIFFTDGNLYTLIIK